MFFKSKPNLPDSEKARIEFRWQQIAECVGFHRFQLPVLSRQSILGLHESKQTPEQVIAFVGNHLNHDVSGLRFGVNPKEQENCGGGG